MANILAANLLYSPPICAIACSTPFLAVILTTSFAADFWGGWSFNALAPQALAYGFSWPVWMFT